MASRSTYSTVLIFALLLCQCSGRRQDDSWDPILHGTIDYPFVDPTAPLGENGPEQKFIVRSTVGNTEYTMEIPGAARDYDIEVPLSDLGKLGAEETALGNPKGVGNPVLTDKELVKAMPEIKLPRDLGTVEGAFGVGDKDGPMQSPSYSYHLAKINDLYLKKQFEYALIEINNLLTYYPTSAKLYKMKGTVLMKMRNINLAEVAWTRAFELSPEDIALRRGLDRLRKRINDAPKTPVRAISPNLPPSAPAAPGIVSPTVSFNKKTPIQRRRVFLGKN